MSQKSQVNNTWKDSHLNYPNFYDENSDIMHSDNEEKDFETDDNENPMKRKTGEKSPGNVPWKDRDMLSEKPDMESFDANSDSMYSDNNVEEEKRSDDYAIDDDEPIALGIKQRVSWRDLNIQRKNNSPKKINTNSFKLKFEAYRKSFKPKSVKVTIPDLNLRNNASFSLDDIREQGLSIIEWSKQEEKSIH